MTTGLAHRGEPPRGPSPGGLPARARTPRRTPPGRPRARRGGASRRQRAPGRLGCPGGTGPFLSPAQRRRWPAVWLPDGLTPPPSISSLQQRAPPPPGRRPLPRCEIGTGAPGAMVEPDRRPIGRFSSTAARGPCYSGPVSPSWRDRATRSSAPRRLPPRWASPPPVGRRRDRARPPCSLVASHSSARWTRGSVTVRLTRSARVSAPWPAAGGA